ARLGSDCPVTAVRAPLLGAVKVGLMGSARAGGRAEGTKQLNEANTTSRRHVSGCDFIARSSRILFQWRALVRIPRTKLPARAFCEILSVWKTGDSHPQVVTGAGCLPSGWHHEDRPGERPALA